MAKRAEEQCVHHFKIASAEGRTSVGACKKCGVKKEFLNSIDLSAYNNKRVGAWAFNCHSRKRKDEQRPHWLDSMVFVASA